ncbi:MAG: fumarate hydratase [Deltaproteobacteria bacterium]|nr:fumarate hydratase [Deltaproteobacteria bacterium]
MREITSEAITDRVKALFIEANTVLGEDVLWAVRDALRSETSETGRYALEAILENADIAAKEGIPLCQDTGVAVVFVELGQDVHITGGSLYEAIQQGVRAAYHEGYLRKSLCDPLTRENTGDNTPAVIHTDIVEGDRLRIVAMPKGGGSENMSRTAMLTPSQGIEGIREFVLRSVAEAGPNPCPPVIVGVGIGGSLEEAALLAKKTLLRPAGKPNGSDERLAELERELLRDINDLGIGPQGFGGRTTALAVHVDMIPCHIASLPVAVNIQCHVSRYREAVI